MTDRLHAYWHSLASDIRFRAVCAVVVVLALIATVGGAVDSAGYAQGAANAVRELEVREPRVVILKSRRLLHLFDSNQLIRTYPIDLGTRPVGPKERKGDGRTPLGSFQVVTKNARSAYHRFIGLNYPGEPAAEWGLQRGLISQGEAAGIRRALREGRCPDWTTALGGGIGIHGRRIGRDWTGGCIALDDAHAEELFAVLRIGDPVEILP